MNLCNCIMFNRAMASQIRGCDSQHECQQHQHQQHHPPNSPRVSAAGNESHTTYGPPAGHLSYCGSWHNEEDPLQPNDLSTCIYSAEAHVSQRRMTHGNGNSR
eukprot:946739-Amphidinium_carterae.1